MEEERLDESDETQNETEPLLRPESSPTYLHFRLGREPQQASRFTAFARSVFKVTFCSLGLWGHQTWNFIPRVVLSAICIFPAVYRLSEDFFSFKGITRQDDRVAERTCFTLLPLGALLSYVVFIGCFITARRKDSALVSPSEAMMLDIQRKDVFLLFIAFVFIIISSLSSLVLTYTKESANIPFRFHVLSKIEEAAVAAQFLAHWASVNTCHIFAVSSFTLGIYERINRTTSDDWNEGHPFRDRRNIALFISYAKERRCGFQVGRITFDTSLTWVSFLLGLTALLFHFL